MNLLRVLIGPLCCDWLVITFILHLRFSWKLLCETVTLGKARSSASLIERAYCQARAYLASPIGLFFLCPRKRCLFKHRDRDECIEWEGGGRGWELWGPSLILAPSALASVSALGDYRPFCGFSETFGLAFFAGFLHSCLRRRLVCIHLFAFLGAKLRRKLHHIFPLKWFFHAVKWY